MHDAHVDDDAAVDVVLAVEDQGLERRADVTGGRRDPGDDGLQDGIDAGALASAGQQRAIAGQADDILDLLAYQLGIGRREINLVDDRDDLEVGLQRGVHVGQCLGLDALRRVDHEQGTLTGGQ